jgi:ATP-dependent helicase/nuclease subunit A
MTKTKDEKLQLTTEQELSLRIDRNLSVMANAGSGKTFVLVERFRRIIDKTVAAQNDIRIDPSRLLAITFTKKAAAEMKKKIINAYDRQLIEIEKSDKQNIAKLSNLKRIREGLTYANISTIHSFCSSLLRQFPIEAGIPINFSEMSEAEKLKLMEQSIDSTIDFRLNSPDAGEREDTELLLSKFTRRQLKELVQSILYKIELFDDFDSFFALDDEAIKEKVINELDEMYCFEAIFDDIKKLTNTLNSSGLLSNKKSKTKGYQNFHEALSNNADTIASFNFDIGKAAELYEVLISFEKIASACFTASNTPRSAFVKMISDEYDNSFLEDYSELVADIRELSRIFESYFYLDEYLHTDRILWDFVKEVRETNEDAKLYLNELDFDDLQLKVRELLKNQEVVKKIRSQIDFIMVDEFQDTNKLQYDIIKSLVPEIKEKTINEDDVNLFIVGDPKQSIYGFRNADVSVFYTAVEDIYEYNSMLIENNRLNTELPEAPERDIDEEEITGKNRLTSTFRLRPAVAAFVNTICGKIMKTEESEYEVDYTPLVCSKDTDKIKTDENNKIIANDNTGEVVFLLSTTKKQSDEDTESEEETGNTKEEELIAAYIKQVKTKNKHYTYNDFAILSRTKSHFARLGKVLSAEGIPFKIHSGNAFYETEEIRDFSSFLNFIYNPDNDVALLAVLRAPFFNISDTDILELKAFKEQGTFWQKLQGFADTTNTENKLSQVYSILNEILTIAPSMTIPQVILLIIEKTGWSGLIEHNTDRYQKMANIDKLIEIARSYEDTGFKNIYDFVEELKFITDKEILESEAAVLTDENAINIMTIHAAKGLQFPVVIIYNTNKKAGGNLTFSVTEKFGPGFSLKLDNNDVVIKQVDSTINLLNKLIIKQKENSEDKRILYVAMTRAEDILAVSVNATEGKNALYAPQGQMKMILDGMDMTTLDELFDETIQINRETMLDIRKDKKIISSLLDLKIERIFETIPGNESEPDREGKMQVPSILIDEIVSKQTYMTYSPSKFSNYYYDKNIYFDKYILGLPEDFIGNKGVVNQANENTPGDVFGTAIHYALQYMEKWLSDDFTINNDELRNLISASFNNYEYSDLNEAIDEIIEECISISQSPLIRNQFENIKSGEAEYFLAIPLRNNIIHGIIDLLLQNENGDYEIWDWKSNNIHTGKEKEETAKHYELQMRIYCYFISKLYPEQNEYTARLLFTRLAGKTDDDNMWAHKFVWSKKDMEETPEIIDGIIDKIGNELLLEPV